jgi:hypothetical protein
VTFPQGNLSLIFQNMIKSILTSLLWKTKNETEQLLGSGERWSVWFYGVGRGLKVTKTPTHRAWKKQGVLKMPKEARQLAHTCNPSTGEAEAGGDPAWVTYRCPVNKTNPNQT